MLYYVCMLSESQTLCSRPTREQLVSFVKDGTIKPQNALLLRERACAFPSVAENSNRKQTHGVILFISQTQNNVTTTVLNAHATGRIKS